MSMFQSGNRLSHVILAAYSVLCLFPVIIVGMNSFKTRKAIFGEPLSIPTSTTFTLVGYDTVLTNDNFTRYFMNSVIVTVLSLLLVVTLGAMAAFAVSEYKFRSRYSIYLFILAGIMLPIRLGTTGILELMANAGLTNTLFSLILVYAAQNIPIAVFLMSEFMKQISDDLKNAARIDGLSEFQILFLIVVPVMRPIIATLAVFTMIPIWNDLWFPLILAPGETAKTLTLGIQSFVGQFVTDWNAVLAGLTIGALPIVSLYIIFSKQVIRGVTSGAVK